MFSNKQLEYIADSMKTGALAYLGIVGFYRFREMYEKVIAEFPDATLLDVLGNKVVLDALLPPLGGAVAMIFCGVLILSLCEDKDGE